MPNRTAIASGTVLNDAGANQDASFRVNLWTQIWDEEDVLVQMATRGDSSTTGVLAAGARSGNIQLSAVKALGEGWRMEAWVTLDRLDPSPAQGISSTSRASFYEPVPDVYGGTLEGFGPTISKSVGRLMEALVEAGGR